MAACDNENFSKNKEEIIKCFDHIEGTLKYYFTEHDEVIIKRDQAERAKKRAKTAHKGDDEDVEMEDIDLPEETEQLGLTPPSKKHSESKSSSSNDDYEKAVEPVDICSIVDEVEGGEFKVINKIIDASGPPDAKALEGMLTRAQFLSSKLPKVENVKVDESQAHKTTYRQIHAGCDRGNIEIIPQHGASKCGMARKIHRGGSLNHLSMIQESTSTGTLTTTSR